MSHGYDDGVIDDDNGVFDEIEKEILNRETLDEDESTFESEIANDDEFFLDQDPELD